MNVGYLGPALRVGTSNGLSNLKVKTHSCRLGLALLKKARYFLR